MGGSQVLRPRSFALEGQAPAIVNIASKPSLSLSVGKALQILPELVLVYPRTDPESVETHRAKATDTGPGPSPAIATTARPRMRRQRLTFTTARLQLNSRKKNPVPE